MPYIAYYIKRL